MKHHSPSVFHHRSAAFWIIVGRLKNVDGYIYTWCRMFSVYTLARSLPVRRSRRVSEATTWPALRSHVKSPVVAFVKLIDPQCAMSFRKTAGIYLPRFSARTALPRTFKPRKMYTREFLRVHARTLSAFNNEIEIASCAVHLRFVSGIPKLAYRIETCPEFPES